MEDIKLNPKTGEVVIGSEFDEHLGRNILRKMKQFEYKTFQINCISGEQETFGSARLRSIRMASRMISKGLRIGDVVLICAVNHLDGCIPFIASQFIGTMPVCLVVGMTHTECKHIIGLAKPKITFSDPEMIDTIKNVLFELNMNTEIVVFGKYDGLTSFSEFTKPIQNEDDFKCIDFDTKSTIVYASCSSGTTGLPKLVANSHRGVVIGIALRNKYIVPASPNQKSESNLTFSSMYWASGISQIIISCVTGNSRIVTPKPFTIEILKSALQYYKPSSTLLMPNLIHTLLKHPELNNIDFSCLKSLVCGGSDIDPDTLSRFRELLPNGKVLYGYGTSEVGVISVEIGSVRGSVGKVMPWIVWKVVDINTEERLGPNQRGELRLKSVTQFKEYFNDPESTKAAFDSENFYKTGDLVYYDEDKNVFIVDRIKEVIKYQNYQIATAEIENILFTFPDILSVAVIGLPNVEDGELPLAFVQRVEGSKITADEIKDFVKGKLSDSKQLRGGVFFVDKMPTTYSGKVDRKALRNLIKIMKQE